MDQNNKEYHEDKITLRLAALLCIVGCFLLIAGFAVDPKGQIHESILVAFGEVMTFVAALLGISTHFKSVIKDLIKHKEK